MAATQSELDAILSHCRALLGAANEFDRNEQARAVKAGRAKKRWQGPYRQDFDRRSDYEGYDIATRVRGMRDEADQWADIWAYTVNQENQIHVVASRSCQSLGRKSEYMRLRRWTPCLRSPDGRFVRVRLGADS